MYIYNKQKNTNIAFKFYLNGLNRCLCIGQNIIIVILI